MLIIFFLFLFFQKRSKTCHKKKSSHCNRDLKSFGSAYFVNLFLLPADHPFSVIFSWTVHNFQWLFIHKNHQTPNQVGAHSWLIFFFRIFDDQIPFKDPFTAFFWKKIPNKISFRKWVEYVASHSLLPQNLGSMGGGDVFLTTSAFFQIGKYIKCWIFSICLKLVYQRVVCVFFFFCVGYCQSPSLNATWHTEFQRYSACIFFQGNDELPRVYIFFGCMELTTFTACNVKCCVESARRCLSFCFGRCSQPNILARFSRVAILPLMETIRLQWSVIHENEIISEKIFHQRSLLDRLTDGH